MNSKLLDMIEKYQKANDFYGEASEDDIIAVEKTLGLKFPSEYREYIKRFGSGGILGEEITGVEGNKGASVIRATERYRKFGLDKSIVVIMDGGEYFMCMDTAKDDGKVYSGDRSCELSESYTSFHEFLIDYFQEAIDNEVWDEDEDNGEQDSQEHTEVLKIEDIFKKAGYTVALTPAGDGTMVSCVMQSPFNMLIAGHGSAEWLKMFIPAHTEAAKNQKNELKQKGDWFYYGSSEAITIFEKEVKFEF